MLPLRLDVVVLAALRRHISAGVARAQRGLLAAEASGELAAEAVAERRFEIQQGQADAADGLRDDRGQAEPAEREAPRHGHSEAHPPGELLRPRLDPLGPLGSSDECAQHESWRETCPEKQTHIHFDREDDAEHSHRLEVTGDDAIEPGRESGEKEQPGRGAHGPLIDDGHVDAADPLADDGAGGAVRSARVHGLTIPQGV